MKANTFINDLLKLLFNATPIGNIADNAVTSPLTNLFVSLHTADPGAAGSQTTSEAAYTGYARVAVARTAGGFTVTGQSVSPVGTITFGACTAGPETETHFAIGTLTSGAGKILWSGPIGSSKGAVTALASTDVITAPGYTPVNADRVSFEVVPGQAIPTGLTAGTVYFVVSAAGSTFKVSLTSGGAAVDITADGDCFLFLHTPIVVTATPSVTPALTTGTTVTES